jgi:hypothetical protein
MLRPVGALAGAAGPPIRERLRLPFSRSAAYCGQVGADARCDIHTVALNLDRKALRRGRDISNLTPAPSETTKLLGMLPRQQCAEVSEKPTVRTAVRFLISQPRSPINQFRGFLK